MTDMSPPGLASFSTLRLVYLSRALAGAIEPCLVSHELGLDHWLALDALATADEGVAMADLQSRTLIAAPTLTRVVDRLVARAAVYREIDGVDRRKVRVRLSKRGTALHADIAEAVTATERDWFDRHTDDMAAICALLRG